VKTEPRITLSVVSHGNADEISVLLTSLRAIEPDIASFQLILTDNLGNDLPEYDPTPWCSLHVLRNQKPLGFADNHNRAFEIADGKHFAILNPDLVFERPIFEQLIASAQTHGAELIAPQVVDANGVIQDSFRPLPSPLELIRRRMPSYKFRPLQPDQDGLIHPDWIAAMFWLMPSYVFRKLEGMDRHYRLYFEDVDFCTRARLAGMKILVDTHLQIRHDAQRSSRKRFSYLLLHTQSALRFFTSPVYRQARLKP